VLSILVVAHEWGHFIVARLCGIRVDDFSIGFGKRLFRIAKRGDTEYNVRMLPLGGFVKIAGMDPDEAPLVRAKERVTSRRGDDDPDSHELPLIAENTPESAPYTEEDGFFAKPLWQRSLVILAGPVMSFVLGYVVFCMTGWILGAPTGKALNKIGLVNSGGEGQRIGLRMGDVIESINGKPVTDGEQMTDTIHDSLGKPLTLTIRRGDQTLTKVGTPRPMMDEDNKPYTAVEVTTPGAVGTLLTLQPGDVIHSINGDKVSRPDQVNSLLAARAGKPAEVQVERKRVLDPVTLRATLPATLPVGASPVCAARQYGVLNIQPAQVIERVSFGKSVRLGTENTLGIFVMLWSVIQHHQLQKNAGGMIFMYQATGLAVKSGPLTVVNLLANLSLSLAIFNLLPIPVLDGGHLLSFFIEWVRRGKRLTEQQQQAFMMTGLAIIGILFVLIMSNDIMRTIRHQLPQ